MVAPLINLKIGAAGQRDLNFDQDFPVIDAGDGNFLNLHILFSVEDGSCHLSIHRLFPPKALPGWMTIFIESGWGWAASFRASTLRERENRWLISRSKSISRFITNCTDSSCNSTEAL